MNPKLPKASPCSEECDEVIWDTLRNNNKEAFAEIYYRFFNTLFQRGLQISNDRELVKDCIHDLFLEIWINKMNLATPLSVKSYLIVSLRRKIMRKLKKFHSIRSGIVLPQEFVNSKEDQIISEQSLHDQQFMIMKAVDCLTKRQKEAIQLKFFSNLKYEEIAGMMCISTDSVYNLVSKAINNLQKGLTKKSVPSLH